MIDWENSSPLLAAKRRTLLDPAFMVFTVSGIILPLRLLQYSAIDTPSLSIHPIPGQRWLVRESLRGSHALPHRASSAKLALYLSTSARAGLLSLSLFNLTALSLSSRASDQHSSLTIYKCQD
jgi:hypothetical protein